ncbi:hypothetical protein [Staphylococcus gallinarum]|uniref:hypothetical protein n=1 Tax=Staphylococcus gallinarum TaxID=1293 RepID=UPI001E47D3B5|nr:hypothetical protein [Staphylococcus gallinarum]MCD8872108.1 hypothetical protein [Staphylococcus gallinarum]
MKIKTKKQLNLPQLIEWAMENNIKDTVFLTKDYSVGFDMHGFIYFNSSTTIPLDTMFTVEVEEEITEDTVFEEILLIVNNGLGIEVYSNYSINDVLSNNEGYYEETVMLILKPDPEVVWTHEKGLVE